MRTASFEPFSIAKHPLENNASSAVQAASGTVALCSGETPLGIEKQIRSSARVYSL
jgi:hypothetical protein